ncbi:MAG: histidine kinase dimerization/phosphoacceptor domain -containing protein [Sulfitobacter sp.]
MRASAHPRQAERLAELRRYDILDTPREADFDDIVALTSKICETPISVINIIDADRQWFKAEVGLNADETPLDTSICSHIILDEDFVEIPDTLADDRLSDNPLCLAPSDALRFYAGARLVSPNGLPLGTLCVLDTRPRTLTDLQREALQVLSRHVMKQLELRRALRQQEILRSEIDHRIKNSLQSVSSALRLYARGITDPAAIDAFDAVRRRIEAVAAVHEQLQRKSHSDVVEMPDYLAKIAQLLTNSAPEGITVTARCDALQLESECANAVGMIASEFAANSIKHGFIEGRSGTITVSLEHSGHDMLRLECSDDGAGCTASSAANSTSLGQTLMQAAAGQLGGQLDLDLTERGATLELLFPRREV